MLHDPPPPPIGDDHGLDRTALGGLDARTHLGFHARVHLGLTRVLAAHDPVGAERPRRIGLQAPAPHVLLTVREDHPHGVHVPLRDLVPGGHEVLQPHAPAVLDRVPQAGDQFAVTGLRGGVGVRCREGVRERQGVRGGRDLLHGRAHDPAVTARYRLQGLQPHEQRAGLGNGQPHGFGQFLRVAQVDVAVVPGRVDELVRHVSRAPAHEQGLQVVDEFRVRDPEVPGRLLEFRALVGVDVAHDVQQPGEVLFGAGLGRAVTALLAPAHVHAGHPRLEGPRVTESAGHGVGDGVLGRDVLGRRGVLARRSGSGRRPALGRRGAPALCGVVPNAGHGFSGHPGVRAGRAHVFRRGFGVVHRERHGVEPLGGPPRGRRRGGGDAAQQLSRTLPHEHDHAQVRALAHHAREPPAHGEVPGRVEGLARDRDLGDDP